MKIAALEQFLSNPQLAGSQSSQVLEKFLLYAKLVKDPFNVFRYMEQKSICIYFPLFWFTKSEYAAEIGDYRNAFLCLKQANDRKNIEQNDQNEKILNTDFKAKIYREQINLQMLKYPPNKRRTVSDFNLMTSKYEDLPGSEEQKNQKLFDLLQTKFSVLRVQKQRKFVHKNQQKPQSWLFEHYKSQQMKQNAIMTENYRNHYHNQNDQNQSIQSKVLKNPVNSYEERLFKSMNTPFKKRDPMRMSKTIDSVEMMKRKKKPQDSKGQKQDYTSVDQGFEEREDQDQNNENIYQDSYSMRNNTVPVGKTFTNLKKKHVKFQKQQSCFRIQRPRGKVMSQGQQSEQFKEIKEGFTERRSILKNKSVNNKLKRPNSEVQFPKFSQLSNRSFHIKPTEQRQI